MEVSLFGRQYFINKILLISITVFLIIGAGILGFFLKQAYQPLSQPVVTRENAGVNQSQAAQPNEDHQIIEKGEEIKVYVTGCVNSPGVVTLEKGQLIDDAIKAAGGATKEADLENINLAYELNENLMLRIKSKPSQAPKTSPEQKDSTGAAQTVNGKAAGSKLSTGALNSGIDIISGSLDTIVKEAGQTAGEVKKNNNLVNINRASQAELENLPNIGPSTAKAIIDYREKNGGFKKVTDIMKITGIKQKTYDKFKDYICID